MAEIFEQMGLVTSTPQEAAKHVEGASIFNVGADVFKQSKDVFQPEMDKLNRPVEAAPGVAKYVSESPEHAALAQKDIEKLSQAETKIREIGERVKGRDLDMEIANLEIKKQFRPQDFNDVDEVKLLELNEDNNELKKFKVDQPGKYDEIINKTTQASKDTSLAEEMFNAFGANVAGYYKTLAQTPALLYDLYFYPSNLIRKATDQPMIQAPEELASNPVVQKYGGYERYFNEKVSRTKESITDSVMAGNYAEAGKIAAVQLSANLPNQIAMLLPAAAGLKVASATKAGLTLAGVQQASASAQENRDQGVSPLTGVPNALAKGTIEAAFESIGTFGVLKKWESALVDSFGKDTARKVVKSTMKAILYSGIAEGNEEALTSAAQDLTDYISGVNPNALKGIGKRAIDAGIIGGLAGSTTTAPTAAGLAIKSVQTSDIVQKQTNATAKAIDTLKFGSDLDSMMKIIKETDMSKLSPQEVGKIIKSVADEVGLKAVNIAKEEIQEWANTKEKAEAFRAIIDPSGAAAAAINAPIEVQLHEWLPFVEKYPDVAELARLNPEDPSIAQAIKYMESLKSVEEKRTEVLQKLGAQDLTKEKEATLKQALDTEQPSRIFPSNDVFGEAEYLAQPTFTEAIEKVLPKGEVKRFNEAQQNARQSVVDNINEAAQYEMNEVVEITKDEAMTAEFQAQLVRLEGNPNVELVERFTINDQANDFVSEMTAKHSKKGYPAFAIDPASLPEDLKFYKENDQLKKHKAFVKGGLNLNEAAQWMGVHDGKTLLQILSQTPSRADIAQKRTEVREFDIEQSSKESVDLNQTALAAAYNSVTANHVAEMKFMREQEWSATKSGIKRIALPLPTVQEINVKAKRAVSQMKVGELNANRFKVGERKSQRIAVEAILKNEVEKAYTNKEAAALNSALTKETHIAIGEVNKVRRFVRKLNRADLRQELKDAGKIYEDAANELLDTFNLVATKSGTAEVGAFQKWAKKMFGLEGKFEIPERLSDPRQSLQEMTVEQTLLVGERLQNILHMARMKNKFYKKWNDMKTVQTLEAFSQRAREEAEKVFDFDMKKNDLKQEFTINPIEYFGQKLAGLRNTLERAQYVISKLDNGKVNGFFNDILYRPIADAQNAEKELANETVKQLQKIRETFGKKEFDNLSSEFVVVPEFENLPSVPRGRITKMALIMMNLNRGNEGNIQALERYGVDRETFKTVMERELDFKHMDLTQRIWDIFKSFEPKIQELQKRTEGTDVKMVQAEPLEFSKNGETRVYPGGYFPILTLENDVKNTAEKLESKASLTKIENFVQKYYAKAMTEQGHLEARSGDTAILDLNPHRIGHSIAQVIHDLTLREAVRDTAKILSYKPFRETVVAVVGYEGYNNISEMVIDVSNSVDTNSYRKSESAILGLLSRLGGGFQTIAIAGKASSVLVQPTSLGLAWKRMGPILGPEYFYKTLNIAANNPGMMATMYDFAAEIHPAIKQFMEDIEGDISIKLNEVVPKRNYPIVTPIVGARDVILETAFGALGVADQFNKTLVVISAYMYAMDGNAEGVARGDHAEAAKYASNLAELTQTHSDIRNLSPIQKTKWAKWMVYFFNDVNNLYNDVIAEARQAKQAYEETKDEVKKRKWKEASKVAAAGIAGMMSTMLIYSSMKLYESFIKGRATPFTGPDYGDDEKDKFLADVATFFFSSPLDMFVGSLPLARDVDFAISKYWMKKKTVDMPLDVALGTFATGITGMENLLKGIELQKSEEKAILNSFGIITKLPTDSFYNYFVDPEKRIVNIPGVVERANESITKFIKKNEGNDQIPQEYIDELQKIKSQTEPVKTEDASVPGPTMDIIKQIESKGKWDAYNPESTAAGIFQFTEKQWNQIRRNAPELGLTENGRVARDQSQQEKAMGWLLEQNSKALTKAELPSTTENLYAAHFLGAETAIKVLKASGDTKLKSLVEEDVVKANGFKNGMKVKEFKNWLSDKTAFAEMELIERQASNGI